MIRMTAASLLLLVATFTSSFAAPPATQSIFDGRSLKGWEGDRQSWRVEDNAITGEIPAGTTLAHNRFLFWKGEVNDFDLTLEFRLSGGANVNSGIQYRSQLRPDGEAVGYQADLDDGAHWLGLIYEENGRAVIAQRGTRVAIAPDGRKWTDNFAEPDSFKTLFKRGEWNTYRITAAASHVEIRINGTLTAVLDDRQSDAAKFGGRLGLQLHAGTGPAKIQFRNIKLQQLGKTTLPQPAPARVSAEFDKEMKHQQDSPVLWHLQPNASTSFAAGNDGAQKLVKGMMLTDGFKTDLVAAEPSVSQPITFTFDDRGRIWVVEAYSYPNKQPEGQGKDNIIILEDKDNDGVFETRKVFADKLNLVSGLAVGMGGVWVGAAPELLFIPDRNHDDKPDGPPEVLLDGWGYQDTHETLNSFIWGPDGWLYGNQGVFTKSLIGRPGTPDDKRRTLFAGVWRYHPTRHEFEIFAAGGSNQWGLDFNSVGHLFMTHCRSYYGGGGVSFVIRNGYYWNQANAGYASFISSEAPDFAPGLKNYLPASAKYDTGEGGAGKKGTDEVYGGHAKVGTMIYLGDNWPDIYRDQVFSNNIFGRQLNRSHNEREGSGYETLASGYDMMYTPDTEYLGVSIQYGPDGAAYISDWADQQHCHNPRDEVWNRVNGRLYRLSWAATYHPTKVDLGSQTDAELVELHQHKNEWYVRTARRLLQERAQSRPIDADALRVLRRQAVDHANTKRQLNALWTLHVIGALRPADYEAALASPAEVVRAWTLQLGTESAAALRFSPTTLHRLAAQDPSPVVRLALASALPVLDADARWDIAATLATHGEDADDRFLPKLIWSGFASSVEGNERRALELAATTPLTVLADSIRWSAARTPAGREVLSAQLAKIPGDAAARTLRIMDFSLKKESTLAPPAGWSAAVQVARSRQLPTAANAAADRLAALFGDVQALARIRNELADEQASLSDRQAALDLLKRVGDPAAAPVYVRLLDNTQFRSAVIPILGAADEPATARLLIQRYADFSDADQTAAIAALTSHPKFAATMLESVRAGKFDRQNLTALHVRQLKALNDKRVDRLLGEVWGRSNEVSSDKAATIARLQKQIKEAPLWAFDAAAGRATFARNCGSCHIYEGAGEGVIGPNLTGAGRNGVDYFLENIVDPNAVVGMAYELNIVTRKDGTVVAGTVESDDGAALVMRTLSDKVTIPKNQIKSREVTPQSMMPPGLLESLPDRDLLNMFRFLLYPKIN